MTEAIIEEVHWDNPNEQEALKAVRGNVFIDEQNIPEELEWDREDPASCHLLARIDNQPVGCVRLTEQGQIGRLSVISTSRNLGIGVKLLKAIQEQAVSRKYKSVFLHAQTHAISFYEADNFYANGGIFFEANIPHRLMEKEL